MPGPCYGIKTGKETERIYRLFYPVYSIAPKKVKKHPANAVFQMLQQKASLTVKTGDLVPALCTTTAKETEGMCRLAYPSSMLSPVPMLSRLRKT